MPADPPRSESQRTIIILAREPIVGALLGMMVEVLGHRAIPLADDADAATVCRESGAHLLLADCDHPLASSGALDDLCAGSRCRTVYFSPMRTSREMDEFSRSTRREAFALPISLAAFGALLGGAPPPAPSNSRARGPSRDT